MAARRAGGKELRRLAQAVCEVWSGAASRRRNSAERSAARIHSGQLLIAGGVVLGHGRSVYSSTLLTVCFCASRSLRLVFLQNPTQQAVLPNVEDGFAVWRYVRCQYI